MKSVSASSQSLIGPAHPCILFNLKERVETQQNSGAELSSNQILAMYRCFAEVRSTDVEKMLIVCS